MSYDMSKLVEGLSVWGIDIDDRKIETFRTYLSLLIEWNNKTNLTAIYEPEDIIVHHFLDSLSIMNWEKINNIDNIIDIGTGAGFPGIPIKIMNPEIPMILVDSLKKRVIFLEELVRALGIKNIDILHCRAEEIGSHQNYRESADLVVARAVASLRVLSEYCIPLVKKEGFFVSYKGPGADDEAKEAENAIKTLGGALSEIKEVDVPGSEKTHKLVIIQKITFTPKKYPRPAGKPKKSPL